MTLTFLPLDGVNVQLLQPFAEIHHEQNHRRLCNDWRGSRGARSIFISIRVAILIPRSWCSVHIKVFPQQKHFVLKFTSFLTCLKSMLLEFLGRGWRPSYRNVLLAVRKELNIPCSSKLSTEDLEAEIFLHLLRDYSRHVSCIFLYYLHLGFY